MPLLLRASSSFYIVEVGGLEQGHPSHEAFRKWENSPACASMKLCSRTTKTARNENRISEAKGYWSGSSSMPAPFKSYPFQPRQTLRHAVLVHGLCNAFGNGPSLWAAGRLFSGWLDWIVGHRPRQAGGDESPVFGTCNSVLDRCLQIPNKQSGFETNEQIQLRKQFPFLE